MRTKSANSKQAYPRYAAPSIGSASEETASDSSFSGDLTEACLSDQHQEQYNSDMEDFDKDTYSTCKSVRSEQSSSYPYSSSSVYQRSIRTTGDSSDLRPKKSLMTLFQPSSASRRGSVVSEAGGTTTGQVNVTIIQDCLLLYYTRLTKRFQIHNHHGIATVFLFWLKRCRSRFTFICKYATYQRLEPHIVKL